MNLIEALLNNESFKKEVEFGFKIFNPKQIIMESGKPHHSMFFICSGSVRIYLRGEQIPHKSLHPGISDFTTGEFFGELGLFNDSSGNAEVITTARTELIEVNLKSFEKYLENHPDMAFIVLKDILKVLIKRMRHTDQSIIKLLNWGLKKRHIIEEL